MSTEPQAPAVLPVLADAANWLVTARRGLEACASIYGGARAGGHTGHITSARAQWCVALLDWADASRAHAAAIDLKWARRHGVPPPEPFPPMDTPGITPGLARARRDLDAATSRYDAARRDPSQAGVPAAHAEWAMLLGVWVSALMSAKTAEDATAGSARQAAQERAMHLDPQDALGKRRTAADEVVHLSRERERQRARERNRRS